MDGGEKLGFIKQESRKEGRNVVEELEIDQDEDSHLHVVCRQLVGQGEGGLGEHVLVSRDAPLHSPATGGQ